MLPARALFCPAAPGPMSDHEGKGECPMALIQMQNLSFHYEGSYDNVFTNASFQLDTDWKLGFIARNGRGKTTLLRILAGELPYAGRIETPVRFSLFPPEVTQPQRSARSVAKGLIGPYEALEAAMAAAQDDPAQSQAYIDALDEYLALDGYVIDALLEAETGKLGIPSEALERPYETLSQGERSKLLLAALFLRKNNFLLIDEPTNHLDLEARQLLAAYLSGKKGFLLVSHDRSLLDPCIDHVLTIDRDGQIRLEKGNYSSWQANKDLQDRFEQEENQRLRGEIRRLQQTSREKSDWADRVERSKIGSHSADRGYVGARSAAMMKKAKALERRLDKAVEDKSKLLHKIEEADDLKLSPLVHPSKRLFRLEQLVIDYGNRPLFSPVNLDFFQGQRLWLRGRNGSGKSSLLRLLLGEDVPHSGQVFLASGLTISFVSQDSSFLRGSPVEYAQSLSLDQSLYLTILRKLGFERVQFEKDMADFSMGQKKKALLAASLCQSAHLYLWDEPLNYIDLLSRVQIENLLLKFRPSMVFIEHDRSFSERVSTELLSLEPI